MSNLFNRNQVVMVVYYVYMSSDFREIDLGHLYVKEPVHQIDWVRRNLGLTYPSDLLTMSCLYLSPTYRLSAFSPL